MAMGVILMPENLRSKLGDEAAKELVILINDSIEAVKKQVLETATDRFENRVVETKTDLEKQIAEVKADLLKQIAEVKTDLLKQIAEVKTDLLKQIAEVKADLLKWMFAFWVGQIVVIFTILNYMLRK